MLLVASTIGKGSVSIRDMGKNPSTHRAFVAHKTWAWPFEQRKKTSSLLLYACFVEEVSGRLNFILGLNDQIQSLLARQKRKN